MFDSPTVFVLGAGASVDYKYPTGADLVHLVTEKAYQLAQYANYSSSTHGPRSRLNFEIPNIVAAEPLENNVQKATEKWTNFRDLCDKLWQRLNAVNPPVIDHFLEQNPSLAEVG